MSRKIVVKFELSGGEIEVEKYGKQIELRLRTYGSDAGSWSIVLSPDDWREFCAFFACPYATVDFVPEPDTPDTFDGATIDKVAAMLDTYDPISPCSCKACEICAAYNNSESET